MSAAPIVKHLTNAVVEGIVCPPDKANVIVWDTEVKGFGVRVNKAGTVRTYLLLYRVRTTRQERQVKIGRHNQPWKVKQARARALDLKGQMDTGVDPVLVQQEQREQEAAEQVRERYETITLREVMDDYLKNHRRRKLDTVLRPATQQDILRHVNGNLGDWAGEPVSTITRDACIERFDAIAETSRAQAAQAFAYLRALLTHAKEMFETPAGDFPLLEVNPVQRMFRKRSPPDEAPRDTRIPIDKVRQVWRMLCSRRHTVDHDEQTRNDWVQFIMLTGCRRTESGSLEWVNVDFDAGTVHFPITKNHVPLTLPMSTQMRELLDRRLAERPHTNPSPFVFPSKDTDTGHMRQAISAMHAVSEVAGLTLTLHDLRRTFVDVCEEVGVNKRVERMLVNHKGRDVHDRHYANSPQALPQAVQRVADWITADPQ